MRITNYRFSNLHSTSTGTPSTLNQRIMHVTTTNSSLWLAMPIPLTTFLLWLFVYDIAIAYGVLTTINASDHLYDLRVRSRSNIIKPVITRTLTYKCVKMQVNRHTKQHTYVNAKS